VNPVQKQTEHDSIISGTLVASIFLKQGPDQSICEVWGSQLEVMSSEKGYSGDTTYGVIA
jgi:hypothetical protein